MDDDKFSNVDLCSLHFQRRFKCIRDSRRFNSNFHLKKVNDYTSSNVYEKRSSTNIFNNKSFLEHYPTVADVLKNSNQQKSLDLPCLEYLTGNLSSSRPQQNNDLIIESLTTNTYRNSNIQQRRDFNKLVHSTSAEKEKQLYSNIKTSLLDTIGLKRQANQHYTKSFNNSTNLIVPENPDHKNSSLRRLKRLSFSGRRNTAKQQSATNALGTITAGRCPSSWATVGPQHANQKQLTGQGSFYKSSTLHVTSEKENISPQSMPDSAQDDQKVDLEKLLKSETARAPFQHFLQQQFCIENLNFYLAVEDYRTVHDVNKRSDLARQIYERHFTPNSVEPVNIDNATAKGIIECIQKENYAEDMYDVAQYQIFHLLKYDCWPRYLNSGGKPPGAKEVNDYKKEGEGSIRKTGPQPGSVSARSTNSAQLNADKREKRKSFFRFLRRNKESSQDHSSESCGPCTSAQCQALSGGIYGESEPYSATVNEISLSMSPAATKRRMTRERSVPAPTNRSTVPPNSGGTSTNIEDVSTRVYASHESLETGLASVSPVLETVRKTSSESASTTPLPSETLAVSNSINLPSKTASVKKNSQNEGTHIASLLHDEKEPCSSCSNNATRVLATNNKSSLYKNTGILSSVSTASDVCFTRLPILYSSAVRSDRETLTPPSDSHSGGLQWQKADYV